MITKLKKDFNIIMQMFKASLSGLKYLAKESDGRFKSLIAGEEYVYE